MPPVTGPEIKVQELDDGTVVLYESRDDPLDEVTSGAWIESAVATDLSECR